jgi:hypothetical protein
MLNGCFHVWTDDFWMDGWMDGWMNGWLYPLTDGFADGYKDEWMNGGWMDDGLMNG